jgi:hypothetical protein
MKLHIVTPCSRVNNLIKVFKTITFPCEWWIVFDADDNEFNNYFTKYNLDFLKCDWIHLHNQKSNFWGNTQRNIALDKISDGYVFFLDDDNIMHKNFYNISKNIIDKNSKIQCVMYSQILENNSIRVVNGSTVRVCSIDQGQYLIDRKLVNETRFEQKQTADGIFIQEIFRKNNKNMFYFYNGTNITYYNGLNNHTIVF